MRKLAAALLLVLGALPARAQNPDRQAFELVERGRYLTTSADCTACHTAIGGKPFAGGRPIETPFGDIVAPNITPDAATGIGTWTADEFDRALRDGIGRGGRRLYPAVPFPYYTKMRRADVDAIRAYLNTIDPVRNPVKADQLPFPFSIRLSMAAWDALFFTKGEFKPDPAKPAEWNRGAYLVQGPEHCGACHTPKNILGADQTGQAFQGYQLQGWYAPNLTGSAQVGLGAWSIDDIALYLKTGRNRWDIASGPMAEEITDSSQYLSGADLRAIAVYLKDQPPGGTPPSPVSAQDPQMTRGAAIYADACAACHTVQGNGIVGLFPRLSGAPLVQQARPVSLIRVILGGSRAVASDAAPTGPAMPSFAWKLSDDEVAAVATYIRNNWGNAAPAVTAGDVANERQGLRQHSG